MTQLVRIGNSQGIRIPKTLIEQAHLEGKSLELRVVRNGLLISPVDAPREGWEEAIQATLKVQVEEPVDHEWLDAALTSDEEWTW